jgi:hypothetical protein
MDQEPLVSEQIEAGRKFLEMFARSIPIRAAFWLKASEDSGWYLNVAAEQFTDGNIREAYGEVLRVAKLIHDPNFDLFRVKLIGATDPLAHAAWEVCRRAPAGIGTHLRDGAFGGMAVEGVYVYPCSVATKQPLYSAT